MINTRICAQCGHLVTRATTAIRSHEADMVIALKLNLQGDLTEELRQRFAPQIVASFNEAQAAWDTYRQHLDEHGLLELASTSQKAARASKHP